MIKKRLIFFFISLFIGGVIFYFVLEKAEPKEVWRVLLKFSGWGIFYGLILTFIFNLLGIWRWQIILKDKGDNLSLKKLISSYLGGFSIDFFAPTLLLGGEIFKGYLIKKEQGLSWQKGVISIFIDKIFDKSASVFFIILGVILFLFKVFTIPSLTQPFFLVLFILLITLIFFYFRAFKSQSIIKFIEKPLKRILNQEIRNGIITCEKEIFDFFEYKNKNLWLAIILSFVRGGINCLRCWTILFFLGLEINILTVLFINAFLNLAYYIPLPATLGSHESLQLLSFSLSGLGVSQALVFVLIFRFFEFLVGFLGIFISFRYGTKWISEKLKI